MNSGKPTKPENITEAVGATNDAMAGLSPLKRIRTHGKAIFKGFKDDIKDMYPRAYGALEKAVGPYTDIIMDVVIIGGGIGLTTSALKGMGTLTKEVVTAPSRIVHSSPTLDKLWRGSRSPYHPLHGGSSNSIQRGAGVSDSSASKPFVPHDKFGTPMEEEDMDVRQTKFAKEVATSKPTFGAGGRFKDLLINLTRPFTGNNWPVKD